MKLTVRDDSKNYTCVVVSLPVLQDVSGLDKLKKVTIFGNDVLVSKDSVPGSTVLFFPAESVLAKDYLSANNEYRHENLNRDTTKKGFFEDSGRVKAIKFKGVTSTGYVAPLDSLLPLVEVKGLKVGDEFTTINGFDLCKKYKPVQQQSTTTKESRYQKKLKRFDKLVPNQFRFHQDTSPLARNLHVFKPEDQIVITDKWHGTSAVFSNVLVKRKLNWRDRVAKLFGVPVVEHQYDNLYSSRSVIKNQYINEEQGGGYYGEDIWAVVNKELAGKIEQGITLYGEIVGYLASGKEIQKGYDYRCSILNANVANGHNLDSEHKFVVYRITYTKPNGEVIEFSWNQIKSYCKKYQIETVTELFVGKPDELVGYTEDDWHEALLNFLQSAFLEKDCVVCKNKVPAEGVCVRLDGQESYSTFKLKSKRFLERETKQLDASVADIETES